MTPQEKKGDDKRNREIAGLGRPIKIAVDTWEYEVHDKYDITITQKSESFYVDIFDAKVVDNNKAYIESQMFDSFEEAEEWVADFMLRC